MSKESTVHDEQFHKQYAKYTLPSYAHSTAMGKKV